MTTYYLHNVEWIDGETPRSYAATLELLTSLHADPPAASVIMHDHYPSVDAALREHPYVTIGPSVLATIADGRSPADRYLIDSESVLHAITDDLDALRIIALSTYPAAHVDTVAEGSNPDARARAAATRDAARVTALLHEAWTLLGESGNDQGE